MILWRMLSVELAHTGGTCTVVPLLCDHPLGMEIVAI